MNETTDERVKQLEHEVKELIGVRLGLVAHVRATRAALEEHTRTKIEAELAKNDEGEFLRTQGKMLNDATVEDLRKLLLRARIN